MLPGTPDIVRCPECGAQLKRQTYLSYSQVINAVWSDGYEESSAPNSAPLAKCPQCQHVYWLNEAETVDVDIPSPDMALLENLPDGVIDTQDADLMRRIDPWSIYPWESYPSEDDLLLAVDRNIARTVDEERILLTEMLWIANHRARALISDVEELTAVEPVDPSIQQQVAEYVMQIDTYENETSEKIGYLTEHPDIADEVLSIWLEWSAENPDPIGRYMESWRRHSYYYVSDAEEQTGKDDFNEEMLLDEFLSDVLLDEFDSVEDVISSAFKKVPRRLKDLDDADKANELRKAITFLCPLPETSPSRDVVELMGPPHESLNEGKDYLRSLIRKASQLRTVEELSADLDKAQRALHSFEFTENEKKHLVRLADLLRRQDKLSAADLLRQLREFDQAKAILDEIDFEELDEFERTAYEATELAVNAKSSLVIRL